MKATLLFIVLALALPVFSSSETYYIDPTGTDAADCGTSDSPCATISYLIATSGTFVADADATVIKAANGDYTSAGNTGITFNMETTIEAVDEDDSAVVFSGNGDANQFGFSSNSTLTISNIAFNNIATAIVFTGDELEVTSSTFNVTSSGIQITGNATDVTITESYFSGAALNSISANLENEEMDTLSLEGNTFQNGAGVTFTVSKDNAVEASISEGAFSDITSAVAISLTNGQWELSDFVIENSNTAISVSGANNTNVVLDDVDVTDFGTGVSVEAGGAFFDSCDFSSPSAIATLGIFAQDVVNFEFTKGSFADINNPINFAVQNVDSTILIGDKDNTIAFNNTGAVTITAANGTVGTFENWSFMTPTGNSGVLNIAGGSWGITSFSVAGAHNNNNGGAFSLSNGSFDIEDSDFTDNSAGGNGGAVFVDSSSFAIDNCNFNNNTATSGAGVYVSNIVAFSVDESEFTGNVATGVGGGLTLASVDATSDNVLAHIGQTSFDSNTATTGAAVACCTGNGACNITLAAPGDKDGDDIETSDNTNTNTDDGQDITCQVKYEITFSTAATNPDADPQNPDSSGLETWVIVLLSIVIILVVLAVILALIFAAWTFYKKRSNYTTIDDGF